MLPPHLPLGSAVCIKRDDGSDRTLLRVRPTNSRADDAFVVPKVAITGDDRLQLLQNTAAEGASFSLVKTSSGVEGYVQSKYIALAPGPAPATPPPPAPVGFDASSAFASGGQSQKQFKPCKHERDCSRAACAFHHFSPANAYSRPPAVPDHEFKHRMCTFAPCTKSGACSVMPLRHYSFARFSSYFLLWEP